MTYVFPNITQARLDTMMIELRSKGVAMEKRADGVFVLDGHGFGADAFYDTVNSTLTLTVTKKPWYIPASTVESALRSALHT